MSTQENMSATPATGKPEATDRLGTPSPPPYEPPSFNNETSGNHESGTNPSNQIFEENEFGEMRPAAEQTGADTLPAHPVRIPSDTNYVENEFGEINREESDPELQGQRQEQPGPGRFGEETDQRSAAFQSDETYAENRFGELGRADTYVQEQTNLSDKLKGTAEQIIGKLTSNKELHDKGVARKSPTLAQ